MKSSILCWKRFVSGERQSVLLGRLRGRAFQGKVYELDSKNIRFVRDCMRENTTKIRNIKQYLQAMLLNALYLLFMYLFDKIGQALLLVPRREYERKTPAYQERLFSRFSNAFSSVYPATC